MQPAMAVRPPAVAGAFYPGAPARLKEEVARYLDGADAPALVPRALIVPHAGYVYSGPIAATAYKTLASLTPPPKRVVLLGPSHHVGFHGLAVPEAQAMQTPLGVVTLDAAGVARALSFSQVRASDAVHEPEHSLEVQLPFLQAVLPDATLVPLAVGRCAPEDVAEVIDALWDDETLVVVSSDLSHYLPYAQAQAVDGHTAQQIVALDYQHLDGDQACGAHPMRGLLLLAKQRGLSARLLDLRNSGDTAGDKDRVVGYGAFALMQEAR
jgi:AmmeMemoRadiSam system protein B